MTDLETSLRSLLEKAVLEAREIAENGARKALARLGIENETPPAVLSEAESDLHHRLRVHQSTIGGFESLLTECAYEHWHRMLFARFLAENGLLRHDEYGVPVSLQECNDLAAELGTDGWALAARFASHMLPRIFRSDDPVLEVPLAPEDRHRLERLVMGLPSIVFTADDSLGWVYQFWQTKRKKEVNASERKIGGADLAAVTQLFTEHYMVRFLLENSLGAWWAARHPDSPLLAEWQYLRFTDEGEPAAGRFEGWPETAAEVTVMDPCCGSGHFLVEAFDMLRKMRAEEEGLSVREAADAVLAENLHGLELDARCVQLAAFNLALAAWKVAGYHELPALNLACSGIPTRASLEDWTRLARGDERLERALSRLHELFRDADTLGSLIDPRRAVEDGTLASVPFEDVAPLLERVVTADPEPVAAVFGAGAQEVTKAAILLTGSYTLVATNPPFAGSGKQGMVLKGYIETALPEGRADLATAFQQRVLSLVADDGHSGLVLPQNWLFLKSYQRLRKLVLENHSIAIVARLGEGAFESVQAAGAFACLVILGYRCPASGKHAFSGMNAESGRSPLDKTLALRHAQIEMLLQSQVLKTPQMRIVLHAPVEGTRLLDIASVHEGLHTGDYDRFGRKFWEIPAIAAGWARQQGGTTRPQTASGLEHVLFWCDGEGPLMDYVRQRLAPQGVSLWIKGGEAWGKSGVMVGAVRGLKTARYLGALFTHGVYAVIPRHENHLTTLWAFLNSDDFRTAVRTLDQKVSVARASIEAVQLDLAHWQQVAHERYPDGLPEPHTEDPTQWLFGGNVVGSEQPLHVALARLLGYRWPDQEPDELDALADKDGIVCLPPVAGERRAHERLRELLAAAYGEAFSAQVIDELLAPEGASSLEQWLRDRAFASHAKLFHNRPFIWHIWDGRPDGFAALVNYHRLDRQNLEKLTYHHLGWWIERQRAVLADNVPGAEARLAAAQELQGKLKLILEGEPPYDIYMRWKPLAEQPLGWEPDLNDGVRLNIRPFVTAGVLRAKFTINWKKDRGKDPTPNASGTVERLNDLHFTLAEKRAAREEARRRG